MTFKVDDLEVAGNFFAEFDFIYAHMMTGSFRDLLRFFEPNLEQDTISPSPCALFELLLELH
jgi:hypothetical protein